MRKGFYNATRIVTADAVVVGTGAAGYAAAVQLRSDGVDCLIVTEGVNTGTSRNTGSDKQTYYKLSLSGEAGDSPAAMAEDLFHGGSADGDNALAEAAGSVACFLRLAGLGVPFPTNRYGEYVGYKTDHDERGRAASAGPLTSKMMTEVLQDAADRLGVPVLDGLQVVEILTDNGRLNGLLALDTRAETDDPFVLIRCGNAVFATGGPAGIYADTVYPSGHTGSSGVLFAAGVKGQNLTEWQYGLASVAPRWNVSGTYMQVLPRFYSTDGTDRRYFLEDAFGRETANKTFLKGYEWPFDSRKMNGSSAVDLLVYRERTAGRKVFLDYTENSPSEQPGEEAGAYLAAAGAASGTPVERLRHMNEPAYRLYLDKGVDLEREPLEISLCAQHCNGGAAVDVWWQTDICGLFVAGEAAGTHGVYRPGGSALNAGQVGGTRAAQYIANRPNVSDEVAFKRTADAALEKHRALLAAACTGTEDIGQTLLRIQSEMSQYAGPVRDTERIKVMIEDTLTLLRQPFRASAYERPVLYKLYDNLICRLAALCAMSDFWRHTDGRSRGSALYPLTARTVANADMRIERFTGVRYRWGSNDGEIQETELTADGVRCSWRPVRNIPKAGGFFENVWRGYRENKNVW